ncbi:MAG: copper chaperone PCu(A)C [Vibrio sp.]
MNRTHTSIKTFIRFSLVGLSLASPFTQAAISSLHVDNLYARETPPNATNSAAFMTLTNTSDKQIELVKANTQVANSTELHTVEMKDDVMKMRQVAQIMIPAEQSLTLKPGGFHVMLLDLKQPLKTGETIHLSLTLANGESQTFEVPVKKVMSGMKHKMKQNQHTTKSAQD